MRHVGLVGNIQVLGRQQDRDTVGSCTGRGDCRMGQVAVLGGHDSMSETEYSLGPTNNLVHKLGMRGRNGCKAGYIVAEARGRRPGTPRWSPRFRTTSVRAVCAPFGLDGDVHVRESVGGGLTVAALALAAVLQRLVDDGSQCEAVKQNQKALFHPDTQPSSPRSRQATRNNRGYHPRTTVRRGRLGRLSVLMILRRL